MENLPLHKSLGLSDDVAEEIIEFLRRQFSKEETVSAVLNALKRKYSDKELLYAAYILGYMNALAASTDYVVEEDEVEDFTGWCV